MLLFFCIIVISFLLTIASEVIKFSRIAELLARGPNIPSKQLKECLKQAEDEYRTLKSTLSDDDYAHHILCMRAEQKINNARANIEAERSQINIRKYWIEIVLGYVLKAILYLTLVIMSIRNRYNPVLVLNEEISLQPLRGLLSFPTGVANAISVPIWILSCNATFGLFSTIIREKRQLSF